MKKILFLQDPLAAMPDSLLSALVNLATSDHSYVNILSLGRLYIYGNVPYYGEPEIAIDGLTSTILPEAALPVEKAEEIGRQQRQDNLQKLGSALTAAGIKYSFSEEVASLAEILKHSAYADLIIADALMDIPGPGSGPTNVSIGELLVDAQCPVLLLRQGDMPPDRILLAYDGSVSSIHAIRAFAYLFPDLRYLPGFVVHISSGEQKEPDDLHYLKDWLPLHFDATSVEVLPGEPAAVLPAFVNQSSGSTLVVMGAYGRSALSRLFRRSVANSILEKTTASLFVTHEH